MALTLNAYRQASADSIQGRHNGTLVFIYLHLIINKVVNTALNRMPMSNERLVIFV